MCESMIDIYVHLDITNECSTQEREERSIEVYNDVSSTTITTVLTK